MKKIPRNFKNFKELPIKFKKRPENFVCFFETSQNWKI